MNSPLLTVHRIERVWSIEMLSGKFPPVKSIRCFSSDSDIPPLFTWSNSVPSMNRMRSISTWPLPLAQSEKFQDSLPIGASRTKLGVVKVGPSDGPVKTPPPKLCVYISARSTNSGDRVSWLYANNVVMRISGS